MKNRKKSPSRHSDRRNILVLMILCLVVFLSFSASPCFAAATHYIRAGATGSNNGSDWTNAYTSWPAFVRGDTYYIAAGSYPAKTFNTANSGSLWIYIKRATTADHGTDTGWSNAYDAQVSIGYPSYVGSSYWSFDGQTGAGSDVASGGNNPANYGFITTDTTCGSANQNAYAFGTYGQGTTNNWIVKHWAFVLCGSGSGSHCGYGIGPYNASNVTIDHVYVSGAAASVRNAFASNVVITNSYFSNNFTSSDCHGGQINLYDASNVDIHNNYFYQSQLDILDCVGNGSGNIGIKFYNNIIDSNRPGVQLWFGVSNMNIGGANESNRVVDAEVHHNTIVNLTSDYFNLLDPGRNSHGTVSHAYNNLFWNVTQGISWGSSMTHNYNASYSGSSISETNGQNASGNPFVNSSSKNFRLTAHTNTGSTLSTPYNIDALGNTRTYFDRGAYESGGGGAPITHAVTPSAEPNGSISPSTPQTVNEGASMQFTVTPNAGFSATVGGTCGGSLVGTTYTTNPISGDCTVLATFTAVTGVSRPSPPPVVLVQ